MLVQGQVLEGMKPTDQPLAGPKNNPMMPLVWTRNYTGEAGKTSRIICSTMGSGPDLESEGLRRLLVNACYWAVGLEAKIPAQSNVDYVGDYKPGFFGFGKFKKDVKPADLNVKEAVGRRRHRHSPCWPHRIAALARAPQPVYLRVLALL